MKIQKMAPCALFAALLCICSWLAVPIGDISITMQTFGIFLCLFLLDGKYGSISIFVYLVLGTIGLPVFSGFRGGLGALLGSAGGYIWGFGLSALLYWLITSLFGLRPINKILSSVLGLLICYLLGSLWYMHIYLNTGITSFTAVLLKCVVPYILPDGIKLVLAYTLANRIKKHL